MFVDPNSWSKTVPPPNWHLSVTQLDQKNSDNTGYQNEDLIVWMRTAAFPNFRKLYRIVDHTERPFREGLPPGSYWLAIGYGRSRPRGAETAPPAMTVSVETGLWAENLCERFFNPLFPNKHITKRCFFSFQARERLS